MREKGFTLIEVMISLVIFSLVMGFGYGMLVSVEQFNLENKILFKVMNWMQKENLNWRSNLEIESKTFIVDQATVYQYVHRYQLSPYMERAEITYHWNVGVKEYHVEWHLDRFLPTIDGEEI